MEKKSKLTHNRKYRFIRKGLERRYSKEVTVKIVALAEKHYTDCERLCEGASEGEWEHLSGTILPTVAVYKALLEVDADHALPHANDIMMELCQKGGAVVGKMMKLPGMKSLFMWLLPKMAANVFGPRCGCAFENYEASKTLLKMDMTACPYCRYAQKLGCPELMPVFCDSDFATYGNLPGIRFERTQTLGTGGERCDFKFVKE